MSGEVIAALVGAVVGFLLSAILNIMQNKINQLATLKVLLNSIKAELQVIWEQYYENIGTKVEVWEDGKMIDLFYPILDNYFIIYDTNANLIGQLDEELAQQIVKTYVVAKGLKDSFLYNNKLLDLVIEYNAHQRVQMRNAIVDCLGSYSAGIKNSHVRAKEQINKLILDIEKELEQKKYHKSIRNLWLLKK